MSLLREWVRRLIGTFRRHRSDADLEEELRSHVEMAADGSGRAGAVEDAVRAAAVKHGGMAQAIEAQRDQRGLPWITSLGSDVRYGWRQFCKNPGFSFAAVCTLALGIGLNTSVFALLNGLVLRPPRVHEPERVISLFARYKDNPNDWATTRAVSTYQDYVYYRDHNDVFSGLAVASEALVTYSGVSDPGPAGRFGRLELLSDDLQVFVQLVSSNYFEVLGARAVLGRTFLPEEDQVPGANAVAVVSHAFWTHRLGADAAIVGKTVTLNGRAFTVVGVANPDFGGHRLEQASLWLPLMMAGPVTGVRLSDRRQAYVDIVGRLKPSSSLARAQAEMDLVAQQNNVAHPETEMAGVRLDTISRAASAALPVAALIMGLTGLVLLLIVANLANLSLARGATRHKEIHLRLALGASRWRIVRQLLTESLVVSGVGGAIGFGLALLLPRVLFELFAQEAGRLLPLDFLLDADFTPNASVVAYTAGLCLLAGAGVGLFPALQTTKADLTSALKDAGSSFGRQISGARQRNLLVIVQVAFCFVLLVGSGLLVRGLQVAVAIDPGFNTKHVVVIQQGLGAHGYDAARVGQFQLQLSERLQTIPGVTAVGLTSEVPLQGGYSTGPIGGRAGGQEKQEKQVGYFHVSPDFFTALGINFVQGRNFEAAEMRHERPLAIINEVLARRIWPAESAVGKQLYGFGNTPVDVVGVVKNTRSGLLWDANPPIVYFLYRPLAKDGDRGEMATVIRTKGDPRQSLAGVRDAILELDGNLRPTLKLLENNFALQLLPTRAGAYLAATLGLSALLITSVGLYGVVAYATRVRTREIGIRIALGARAADVLRLVLGQGWKLMVIGGTLGALGAAFVGQLLASFIYGVSPLDPMTFGSVAFVLFSVATLACWLPARRAARVDPLFAMRHE